jgi:Effector Associated Constant Component 1
VGEVLTVVLGAGGAAGVLARSLNTWLRTRRPTVTLTVSVKDRSATLEAHHIEGAQVDETLKILRAVLDESIDD